MDRFQSQLLAVFRGVRIVLTLYPLAKLLIASFSIGFAFLAVFEHENGGLLLSASAVITSLYVILHALDQLSRWRGRVPEDAENSLASREAVTSPEDGYGPNMDATARIAEP